MSFFQAGIVERCKKKGILIMANALMDRVENIEAKPDDINYTELELELDGETYAKLLYCQKELNVSMDEVIRRCVHALKDEILK